MSLQIWLIRALSKLFPIVVICIKALKMGLIFCTSKPQVKQHFQLFKEEY